MAQLAKRSLPTPENHRSNPDISNIYWNLFVSIACEFRKDKNKWKKRPGMAHLKKKTRDSFAMRQFKRGWLASPSVEPSHTQGQWQKMDQLPPGQLSWRKTWLQFGCRTLTLVVLRTNEKNFSFYTFLENLKLPRFSDATCTGVHSKTADILSNK